MDRKKLKADARKTLKHHYWLLTFICAIAMIAGVEFKSSRTLLDSIDREKAAETTSVAVPGSGNQISQVFNQLIDQRYEEASASSQSAIDTEKENAQPAFGRTRGILSQVVNNISSGLLIVQIAEAIRGITHSPDFVTIVLIIGAFAYYLLIWVFFLHMISAIIRRLFMEARTYEKVPFMHWMFIKSVRKWFNTAMTILLENTLLFAWSLTIAGGFIKRYSYFLTDYIIAENPDIKPLRAITLSRRMMNGHKWEAAKLELSMLGWDLLSVLTGGLAGIFFTNAYRSMVITEYYVHMRSLAKENSLEDAELLNDTYLFEKADPRLLETVYSDIEEQDKYIESHHIELTPKQRFWVENFSIWPGRIDEKREWQNLMSRRYQVRKDQETLEGHQYPVRLNSLWVEKTKNLGGDVFFMRTYTVWSLVLLFFALAMFGWFWEVALTLLERGMFVNRGTMYGPWLPIYGFGGVLCLVLLTKLRDKPPLAFAASIVLCGFMEYMASWILELAYGNVWWSYNGYFLNLHGRICAEGLLVFGIGCMVVIYLAAPIHDTLVSRLPKKTVLVLSAILLAGFAADRVYSTIKPNAGEGITDDDTLKAAETEEAEWMKTV